MAWWVRKQSLSKPGNFSYVLAANNPSGKKDNIYSGFVNEIHSNIPLSRGSIYEYYFIYHIFVLFFVLVDLFLVFLHTRKYKRNSLGLFLSFLQLSYSWTTAWYCLKRKLFQHDENQDITAGHRNLVFPLLQPSKSQNHTDRLTL